MLHANLLMSNIAPPIVDGRDISRQFGAWSPRQQETGHGPNFRPQSFRGGSLRRSRAPALKRLKDVGVVLPAALELTVRLDELHAERLKLAELRGPVRALVELDRDVVPAIPLVVINSSEKINVTPSAVVDGVGAPVCWEVYRHPLLYQPF